MAKKEVEDQFEDKQDDEGEEESGNEELEYDEEEQEEVLSNSQRKHCVEIMSKRRFHLSISFTSTVQSCKLMLKGKRSSQLCSNSCKQSVNNVKLIYKGGSLIIRNTFSQSLSTSLYQGYTQSINQSTCLYSSNKNTYSMLQKYTYARNYSN